MYEQRLATDLSHKVGAANVLMPRSRDKDGPDLVVEIEVIALDPMLTF